jgi:hypothetical protein
VLTRGQAGLYCGGAGWERELEAAIAERERMGGLVDSLLLEPGVGGSRHKPPRRSLPPFPSSMMGGAAGPAGFTFGFDPTTLSRSDETWGYTALAVGTAVVAGPTTSGVASKLWLRSGNSATVCNIRINIYACSSLTNWGGALVATGIIASGVPALTNASVSVTPFTITNGSMYGLSIQAAAGGGSSICSAGSAAQNQYWNDDYADGPMNPGPNPTNPNGINRTPMVWCSN